MTTLIKNADVRTIAAGINVSRAVAVLPATALQSIYTVTGGRILVVSLTGTVVAATDATVTTLSVGITPTLGAGTSKPAALAVATAVTSREAGTMLGLGATIAAALVVGADASVPLALPPRQVVGSGAITITTSATNAGTVKWDLTYIPLDVAAQVAAA